MKKLVWLLFLLPTTLWAQTITTVTGTIQTATGAVATSGYVLFNLQPQNAGVLYRVSGTTIVAPQSGRCGINSSGNIVNTALTGPCQVWANGVLAPGNSAYQVVLAPNGAVTSTINQVLISGNSYDLNNPTFATSVRVVPEGVSVTSSPLATNLLPATPSTFNVGSATLPYASGYFDNLTVNDQASFPDTAVEFLKINQIRKCDKFPGAAAGAKIAACIADLPSAGGIADARGIEGAQSWIACPFTGVTKNVDLYLGASTTATVTCTIPANITLWLGAGSILSVNSGSTLTLSGRMIASLSQHFGGLGTVLFSAAMVDKLYPQYWGAVVDGTTNDAIPFQSSVTAAAVSGIPLVLTRGTFQIDSATTLSSIVCNPQTGTSACGLTITGSGSGTTYIKTSLTGDDLLTASTGATYSVINLSGFTVIGPDSTPGAGVSGNGIKISGVQGLRMHDLYVRNFYGAGKAGIWIDGPQGATLDTLRVDHSDIGFKFTNSANITYANNLQTSATHSYGYYLDTVAAGTFNSISAQGTNCTGLYMVRSSGNVFNTPYFENNNVSGSCYAIDLESNVRGNSFIGLNLVTAADKLFLNGSVGGANPVTGNTFLSGCTGGSCGPVIINNANSYPNYFGGGFQSSQFSGTGNTGFNFQNVLSCQFMVLADGATSAPGSICNMYQTANSAPTTFTTLPVNTLDGFKMYIEVNDSNTTFGNADNLLLPGGVATIMADYRVLYEFTSFSGFWILTGY